MNRKMRQQLTQQKKNKKLKSKEASKHKFKSCYLLFISLLAPGRFRGLGELGVSLDWKRQRECSVKQEPQEVLGKCSQRLCGGPPLPEQRALAGSRWRLCRVEIPPGLRRLREFTPLSLGVQLIPHLGGLNLSP